MGDMMSHMASHRDEMLEFEQEMGTPLEGDDFELVAPSSSKAGVHLDEDLAKSLGIGRDTKPKNKEEGKWERESKLSQNSTKHTMEKQVMKFKSELAKEENLLETVLVDAKEASMEQKKRQSLNKSVKAELKRVTETKCTLQTLLAKKSFKEDEVKGALQEALACLTAAKKTRASSQKTLKQVIVEEEE